MKKRELKQRIAELEARVADLERQLTYERSLPRLVPITPYIQPAIDSTGWQPPQKTWIITAAGDSNSGRYQ